MKFNGVLLYTVLILKYTFPEHSLDVGCNRYLTTTYFDHSNFEREYKSDGDKEMCYGKFRSREFELSGGSDIVNGRQISETLLNEVLELGTHNGTRRREGDVSSASEGGDEGVTVEFEGKARESILEFGTSNGTRRREGDVTSSPEGGDEGVTVEFAGEARESILEFGTNNGTRRREGDVTSAPEGGDEGVTVEFEEKAREDAFNVTTPEEHPYSVLLLMYSSKNTSLGSCSGSLLSASWVLTVAHCVSTPPMKRKVSYVLVYAGGRDKQEVVDRLPANTSQTLRSLQIYRHPRHAHRRGYDVALIKVDGNFSLTSHVNVVRLSTRPWSHRGYLTCEVTAFGSVQLRKSSPDDASRKTHRLRVKKPCYCSYRLKMQVGARTAERYICTQPKEDYGLCSGDSGSGLVCNGEIRGLTTSLVQMVNVDYCIINKWPRKVVCGSRNTLTVFLSTCPFLTWINSHASLFNSTQISAACVKASATSLTVHNNLYTILTSLFVSLGLAYEFNKIVIHLYL